MANISTNNQVAPVSITKFLGLNMNETGDTQLELGESGKMVNFRITKDYKLEKMYGYEQIYDKVDKIRAMWVGNLNGTDMFIYVCGGKVYNADTEIGTLTDDITNIFEFNKKLYFINGHEYKSYDGTTFGDVEGYIPTTKINCDYLGNGVEFEPINLISNKRKKKFNTNNSATTFYLDEKNITSVDRVIYNGTDLASSDYAVNLVNGSITTNTTYATGENTLEVQWTKTNDDAVHILNNKYVALYGLASDTRIFLYGNADAKNRLHFSELAKGVPSAEYFPATNHIDIGSSNTAITDINRQYDRLIISKENETYYASYEAIIDPDGNTIITFPPFPLNVSHGMVAYGQGQVLDNNIVTIDSSLIEWVSTNTKDERNAQVISSKIQEWLNDKDLTKAVTLDYQEEKEYWLAIDKEIMIYNYGNGTFYFLQIPSKITILLVNNGIIYMGTETGEIHQWGKDLTTYNGTTINAEWQSSYMDLGVECIRKTMRMLWLSIKPNSLTSVDANYITDKNSGAEDKNISNRCIDYNYWNYAKFTYNTQRSVKPFRIKLKAKKFAFLKLIIKNNQEDEKLTINSLVIKQNFGGEVK